MSKLGSGIGSAAGSAIGTALLPGIGTAIGSGLGGIFGGLFGGGDNNQVTSPYTNEDAQHLNNQTSLTAEQQQQFLNQLQAQNGAQNQTAVFNQLQGVANGQGPNPAAAMLANSTGANVAQQAALMAAQRGAGANPALIARQAAMQGANIQQQAAGQGAALQANQSLNALGQLGGIAGAQVAQQQQGLNSLANTNIAQQNSVNNSLAGANTANASINATNNAFGNNTIGGALSGVGTAVQTAMAPKNNFDATTGEQINKYDTTTGKPVALAHGGKVELPHSGPRSHLGRSMMPGTPAIPMMASGGKVPVKLSPGEVVVDPRQAMSAKDPLAQGQKVPGKAMVSGDSPKNDTFSTSLEPGSVVIPRSILEGANPHEAAAHFIAQHLKKNKAKK